jgi:hypothetical protein
VDGGDDGTALLGQLAREAHHLHITFDQWSALRPRAPVAPLTLRRGVMMMNDYHSNHDDDVMMTMMMMVME